MPPSWITPEKVEDAFVIVRFWAPSETVPLAGDEGESPKVTIEAPAVVWEMSNVPPVAMNTPDERAMEPVAESAKVPPEIVVAPV
jgi:hypothetical protein